MANVLILEDDENYAKCLYIMVKKLGHCAVTFFKPSEAIAQNMITNADLIISDYEMEDETVLDLLEYLKKNNFNKVVLVNSGYAFIKDEIDKKDYSKLVAEYTNKSITKEILKKYI